MLDRFLIRLAPAVALIAALTGCTPHARPAAPGQTPAAQAASSQSASPSPSPDPPAPTLPAPATPPAKNARLLLPDPLGRYIADVDLRLRILSFEGQVISVSEFPGDSVQQVLWSPRGDLLLAITGKPTPDCCDLFEDARYWLVSVPQGTPRELTGLPQEVVFTWAGDERSLYVLDNWRRQASLNALGERIQRYDLATGQLTFLLDRHGRLSSVAELSGGDLLVGQYAGGGHKFYYRLPSQSDTLVTAAPFHMVLSPDKHWAAESNLYSLTELAIADVQTGQVTHYQPNPGWPPPGEKGLLRVSDPAWGQDSRWLMYTVGGSSQVRAELRFFDRKQAEPDRVVHEAQGVWLPGSGLKALVFRYADGSVQPWRYDVAAGELVAPVGPKAPAAGGKPGDCEPVSDIRVSAGANTAAYLTCDNEAYSLWIIDLTARVSPLTVPVDADTRLLSLSADGKTAALSVASGKDGRALRLITMQRE